MGRCCWPPAAAAATPAVPFCSTSRPARRVAKVGDELDAVLAADISPDHSKIALSGPQRLIRIYRTEHRRKAVRDQEAHGLGLRDRVQPGRRAAGDGGPLERHCSSGKPKRRASTWTCADTPAPSRDVAWRPDSNVLASCSMDGTVKLWEMTEGKTVKSWAAHGGGVQCVEYTHDGRLATAGRDNTAKIWDGDGKQLLQFPSFPEPALEVTFTHDGKRVVAGDWSGQVHMWEAADGKPVADLVRNPPTLPMVLEAAQAKFNAAQAAAQKAQAELTAVQQAVAEKAKAAQAAAEQAAAAATAAQQAEAARVAAEQAVQNAGNTLKTATETMAAAQTASTQAAQAAADAAKLLEEKTAAAKAAADAAAQGSAGRSGGGQAGGRTGRSGTRESRRGGDPDGRRSEAGCGRSGQRHGGTAAGSNRQAGGGPGPDGEDHRRESSG